MGSPETCCAKDVSMYLENANRMTHGHNFKQTTFTVEYVSILLTKLTENLTLRTGSCIHECATSALHHPPVFPPRR